MPRIRLARRRNLLALEVCHTEQAVRAAFVGPDHRTGWQTLAVGNRLVLYSLAALEARRSLAAAEARRRLVAAEERRRLVAAEVHRRLVAAEVHRRLVAATRPVSEKGRLKKRKGRAVWWLKWWRRRGRGETRTHLSRDVNIDGSETPQACFPHLNGKRRAWILYVRTGKPPPCGG